MLKVGLTGGIGSGKSTVAKVFEAYVFGTKTDDVTLLAQEVEVV